MEHLLSALALLCLLVQSFVTGARAESGPTNKPLTLAQVWSLDATYRDPTHGVTFRYPSVWRPTTELAFHAPALEHSFALPIAEFAYDEDGFPRDRAQIIGPYSSTNLEAVGILYSAINAPDMAKCREMAASLTSKDNNRHATVVFGGRSFFEFETGEDGMMQSISGSLYATYANHTCYLFETDVAVADDTTDIDHPLTKGRLRYIFAHLESIMKSVRISWPR
jgi:hypothetical protein